MNLTHYRLMNIARARKFFKHWDELEDRETAYNDKGGLLTEK